jgi:hypothetical protein
LKLSDIFAYIMKAVVAAPAAIQMVEAIHGEAVDGATKTKLAADSLAVATGVFSQIDPADTESANAISSTFQTIISTFGALKPAPTTK